MNPYRILAMLTALFAMISGCSLISGEASLAERTEHLRFLWSAEPGIHLATGPSVPIRAIYESSERAFYSEDNAAGYSGWQRSAQSPSYARDWPSLPRGARFYGTIHHRIMSLTEQEDHSWKAAVCSFNPDVFAQYPDGKYRPIDPQLLHPDPSKGQHDDPLTDQQLATRGIGLGVLVLRQRSRPAGPPPPPQLGSALTPTGNVFDGWEIVDNRSFSTPGHWVEPEYRKWNYCLDVRPDSPEKQVQILRSVLDSPPPLPAPVPGWPASPEA